MHGRGYGNQPNNAATDIGDVTMHDMGPDIELPTPRMCLVNQRRQPRRIPPLLPKLHLRYFVPAAPNLALIYQKIGMKIQSGGCTSGNFALMGISKPTISIR